jgi:rare lipoprotein A
MHKCPVFHVSQGEAAAGSMGRPQLSGVVQFMSTRTDLKLPNRSHRGYYIVGAGLLCAIAVTLAGCSGSGGGKQDPFAGVGSPYWQDSKGPMPKGGGRRHVGKPYEVAGQKFYPHHDPNYDRTGVASWYGPKFHRRMTSNGEWFDMEQMTAAHTTMELPSYAKVTNLENGRSVIVRVNDRGPFVNNRIIDMSKRSADALGFRGKGKAQTRVQYIGPAPIKDPHYGHLAAMNQELERGTPLRNMIAGADLRDGRYGSETPTLVAASTSSSTASIAPASADAGYFVQVAAFSDPSNAQRTKADLSDLGNVQVDATEGSYGQIFRVRLGPLADEAQAEATLDAVRSRGHHDARLRTASR